MIRAALAVLLLWCLIPPAIAHELRPAYLELRQLDDERYAVLWKVPARGDLRLALYPELREGTQPEGTPRIEQLENAFVERWTVRRTGGLTGTTLRIAGLDATVTDALVRIERLDGSTQVARLTPSSPAFVIEPVPGLAAVAGIYLGLGIEHILLGYDHLLFVLALMLLSSGRWALVKMITAFTVAHSITLALAVFGLWHVPQAPVEAVIALSIVLLASEIARGRGAQPSLTTTAPWLVAFGFGLLHGLGFAGALLAAGLPPGDVPLALVAFNVGVEIGQLLFIAVVIGVPITLVRLGIAASLGDRIRTLIAYGIGTLSMVWFFVRVSAF